ncbi:hypothetical protein Tco_0970510 [Tanacetum coccineum]
MASSQRLGCSVVFNVNSKTGMRCRSVKTLGNERRLFTPNPRILKTGMIVCFRVDSFACHASLSWSTQHRRAERPFLEYPNLNAEHCARIILGTLTHPEFPFRDEMDMLSFIRTADPIKVRVGERQRADGEPRILETTVGRVVPLLHVAPARTSSELEASVDKLFGEGGGGKQVEQGDSTGGGQGVDIQPIIAAADTIVEDVAPLQPMCQKKRKTVLVHPHWRTDPTPSGFSEFLETIFSLVYPHHILLRAKGEEVDSLKAQLLVKEAEAAEAIRLRTEASKFEVVEKSLYDEVGSLKERNTTLENEKSVLDVRVSDLAATVKSEQELLDLHALEVTMLRKRMYLSALGSAIPPSYFRAIEKWMQDGLAAGIETWGEWRSEDLCPLINPFFCEEDYNAALHRAPFSGTLPYLPH